MRLVKFYGGNLKKIKGQIVICPFILMSPKTQRANAEQFLCLFVSSYSFVQKAPPVSLTNRKYIGII